MNRIFFPILFILLLHAQAWSAPDGALESRYQNLKTAFEKGDFEQAKTLGEKLIEDHHLSPELFQILGHTYYRLGDYGRATLWYKRASIIPPPSIEIRQNLAHIHEKTGNLSFPSNSLGDQISSKLSRTHWLVIAVTGAWIFLFSLVLTLFFTRFAAIRSWLILVQVLALLVTIASGLSWRWHPSDQRINPLAVVTAKDVIVYASATVTSGSVIKLPPGSEVRRLEDRGDWSYVEVQTEQQEARRGWIKNSTVVPLWPYGTSYLDTGL
ncbi:hypothetical protein BH11VER1_BH11VER1_18620 [soil metagenome]